MGDCIGFKGLNSLKGGLYGGIIQGSSIVSTRDSAPKRAETINKRAAKRSAPTIPEIGNSDDNLSSCNLTWNHRQRRGFMECLCTFEIIQL